MEKLGEENKTMIIEKPPEKDEKQQYEESKDIELEHYFYIGETGYLIHAQWIKQYVIYLENERIIYPKPPIDTSEFGEDCFNFPKSKEEIFRAELNTLDRIIDRKLLSKDGKSEIELLIDYDSNEPLNFLINQNPEAKVNNLKDIFSIHDVLLDPQMVPDSRSTYCIVSKQFEEFIRTRKYELPLMKPFSIPRMCIKDVGIKVKFELKPAKFQINFLPTQRIFNSPSKILKFMLQISKFHTVKMLKYRLLSLINSKLSLNVVLRQFQIHSKTSDPYMEVKTRINTEAKTGGVVLNKFTPNSIRLWVMCDRAKPSLNSAKDFVLDLNKSSEDMECEKNQNEIDQNSKYFIESDYSLFDGVFNRAEQFKPNGICLEHFNDVLIDHLFTYLNSDESQKKCIYVEIADSTGKFMLEYEPSEIVKSGMCLECCISKVLVAHDKATSQSFCSEICMNSFNS